MMTLEEVWENLRQDPEIKATMEEADKSYKLFKKIENLIVSDLEAKLAESKEQLIAMNEKSNKIKKESYYLKQKLAECEKDNDEWAEICDGKLETINRLIEEKHELQQQLEEWEDGTIIVKWTDAENKVKELEQQLAEKEKFLERIMSGEYIPANIAEKSLKLSNQTAIDVLQEVKDWIGDLSELRGYEWNKTLKYLNDKIKSLKGEK